MKISVTNGTPVGETEQFQYLKDCGFDATDFSLGHYFERSGMFGDIDNVTDKQIKEHFTMLKECADKAGFEIGQTHSAFTGHPRNYDFDIDEIVKRQIASIKATHYLGSKYCVVHPIIKPGRRYDFLVKEAFDESVDFYKRLIPTLEEYDVYCCIENMWVCDPVYNNICSTILSHAQEMVDMCNVLGDRFRICIDVGHGPLTQDDAAEMVRISGDKLAVLHTHDNDGMLDLHTFPYSAHGKPYGFKANPMRINWEDFMKALDDVNYRGNLSFEMTPPGPRELWAAGYKYLAEIAKYLVSLREIKY